VTHTRIVDWSRAACQGRDRDLFFEPALEDDAVTICLTPCPIRLDCLHHALTLPEKYGVWGGLTERQRYKIRTPRHRVKCPGCESFTVMRLSPHHEVCEACGVSWTI
jgi:WhiB family redox-sensing transcriptional regulator